MNNRRIISLGIVGLLAALLMTTVVWAGSRDRAPTAVLEPTGHKLAPAAVVSDTISYQGQLLDSSGNPVDGARTIDFRLYEQPTGGMPLWSQSESVAVEDGLFNTHLHVDPAHFDGRSLWLGVQVQGDAQEMAPRQPLLPVPYALSLRPGAAISGTVGSAPTFNIASGGIGLAAETTSSADPRDPSILGLNHGTGPGVEGHSDSGPALLGISLSGPAIFGASDNIVGVHGESLDGHGGFFTSTNSIGVTGFSINDIGVEGRSVDGAAAIFSSDNGPGIRVESAGLEGIRILDTVVGDYIVAGSDADLDFRVDNTGEVFADGAYNCGLGTGANPEPGTCIVQNSQADFAEMLPARQGLEPGDVLVIGHDGRLARSSRSFESAVIGVYSSQPGYLGGGQHRGSEGYAPLAIVGVVPVKASAENGPIEPGDLLAASATSGHAMRAGSNPPVGTVVGKALEELDAGTGVIIMLVMLQ